jgi:predicted RNA-binding protein with PIN domain
VTTRGPHVDERVRRRPVRLPPAVLDDSIEAAEHLVRVPGALLLVDGYNISHAQWHGLALADQRARLLDACAELHARCGVDIEVVFDGAGEAPTVGTPARGAVRHRFTPVGEEADDVILARTDEEPAQRPVLVATSDRRVRDGARRRGANVLGARQLLGVLRR